jgi:hypothetical protein
VARNRDQGSLGEARAHGYGNDERETRETAKRRGNQLNGLGVEGAKKKLEPES